MKCRYPWHRNFIAAAFLTGLFLMTGGCSKDRPIAPAPDLPSRTILYYLAADNNLHDEAAEKINALRAGFPGGNHNRLVVYNDSWNEAPQLLEIYSDDLGNNQTRSVKTYTEQNSAAGETVQLILTDLKKLFPADSYGLILFSHATGWLPSEAPVRPESVRLPMGERSGSIQAPVRTYTVAMDGTNELGLQEFASAIPDHFFHFIAFEACFMAGIEVLYELKDKSEFIVSSSAEILSPGFTPVYRDALQLLFKQDADLVGFAKAFFDYWDGRSGDFRSATITVVNTAVLGDIASWVRSYALEAVPPEQLDDIQHFDRYRNRRFFFDFGDYYRRKALTGMADRLDMLLDDLVLFKAATPTFIPGQRGFIINHHSGVTTYITQQEASHLDLPYRQLAWYGAVNTQ